MSENDWEIQETSGVHQPRYLESDGNHGVIYFNVDEGHWDAVVWLKNGLSSYSDGYSTDDEAQKWADGFIKRNAHEPGDDEWIRLNEIYDIRVTDKDVIQVQLIGSGRWRTVRYHQRPGSAFVITVNGQDRFLDTGATALVQKAMNK